MITGIDHLVLLCPSIAAGQADFSGLLGRGIDWQSLDARGAASAMIQLDNVALELLAPHGQGPLADRLHALLAADGPGLQTLVFASDDIDGDHRRLVRRGLAPGEVEAGTSTDETTGRQRHWRRFRIDDARSGGVRIFVLQRSEDDPLQVQASPDAALVALDHLVISTAAPDHALAFYGARLGLELELDRTNPEQSSRLLVFRTGTCGIEVSHFPAVRPAEHRDRLWGITWRTRDIEAAHQRLVAQGRDVSAVRAGMRRGTRVCTVRDGALGVPTLVVAVDGG